eukprot:bmy_11071T0
MGRNRELLSPAAWQQARTRPKLCSEWARAARCRTRAARVRGSSAAGAGWGASRPARFLPAWKPFRNLPEPRPGAARARLLQALLRWPQLSASSTVVPTCDDSTQSSSVFLSQGMMSSHNSQDEYIDRIKWTEYPD